MTIPTVQSLSTLNSTDVQNALSTLIAQIQALNPQIDSKKGALKDLLFYTSSVLSTANQYNIDLIQQSNSLLSIAQNPTLADPSILAALASNFKITPIKGAKASGSVTFVLSSLVSTVIASNLNLSIGSVLFRSLMAYTVRTSANDLVSQSDILLTQLGSNYVFTIQVQAEQIGTSGNIPRNTTLAADQNIPNLISIYAASDFTGGQDDETTLHLQQRLVSGISSATLSNRTAINSQIINNFPNTVATSVLGFSDPEMQRYHSVFPVSFGGRVDVYLKTQQLWSSYLIPSQIAYLISKTANLGTWQINVSRDMAPGFYEVDSITQVAGGNNYPVSSDVRSFDISTNVGSAVTPSTTFLPDITSGQEAAFSRYQTAVIQFVDTDTDATSLTPGVSTRNYAVAFRLMPNLVAAQDLLSVRSMRNTGGDCLVKGAIPCFTSVSITLNVLFNSTLPIVGNVQNAVAANINTTGFVGSITVAQITAAVQAVIPSTTTINNISLSARLRRTNLVNINMASTSALTIVADNTTYTTSRTVGFFCRPSDVSVNLVTIYPTN